MYISNVRDQLTLLKIGISVIYCYYDDLVLVGKCEEDNTTTTTVYFNEVVFPSVLGSTSPMAFLQHSPPS